VTENHLNLAEFKLRGIEGGELLGGVRGWWLKSCHDCSMTEEKGVLSYM